MNPVFTRLMSQQLVTPLFGDAISVVEWMGAMQAQDYAMMRLAVALRLKNVAHTKASAMLTNAFNQGQIIRMHTLRMTWQLMPRDMVLPILNLCSARNMRTLQGWTSYFGFCPDNDLLQKTYSIVCDSLCGGKSQTLNTLCETLRKSNIAANRQQARYLIHYAEIAGLVCNGNHSDKDITYALLSDKVGIASTISRDEALQRLARAYFRSHAPASEQDFAWWSGLTITDCRKAMHLIADELTAVVLPSTTIKNQTDTYYLHSTTRTRAVLKNSTILLPAYDEYLIGYKSRHMALPPEKMDIAHTKNGLFYPVTLTNGIVTGRWKRNEHKDYLV